MKRSLCLIMLLFTSIVYSQDLNFVGGYIISNNSKIEFVDIAFIEGNDLNNYCIVKPRKGDNITYYPKDIKGYGYVGGKLYNSTPDKQNFAEVLVKGQMSLWKYKKRYWINYDDNTYEPVVNDSNSLLQELRTCEQLVDVKELAKKKEKHLKEIVITFNECKGARITLYEDKRPSIRYEVGLTGGINQSKLKTSTTGGIDFNYLGDYAQSNKPFYGFVLNLSFPRLVEGLSIQQEVQLSSSSYSALQVVSGQGETRYYDTFISLDNVSIPISFKYIPVTFKGFSPFIQLGLNFRSITAETKLTTELVEGSVVRSLANRDVFLPKGQTTSPWIGVGVMKEFKSIVGELFIRSYSFKGMSESRFIGIDESQISMGISIRYSKEVFK